MKHKLSKKMIIIMTVVCISIITVSAAVYNAIQPTEIVEDNGYYEGTGDFDKKMTPVTNMLIILKVLNGSNLCDNDWYKQVRECQKLLKKQAVDNKKDKNPYVQKMMSLQLQLVDDLHQISSLGLGKKANKEDIDQLQKTFDAYSDYYYQTYPDGEAV